MEHLDNIKVLVVDDDTGALIATKDLLTLQRAVVAIANSGDEAMDLLRTFQPDVIVSDIGMPVCDGYQFMRRVRVRAPHDGGTTPAIALTAHTDVIDHTLALLTGFNLHLSKPVKPAQLCSAIKRLAQASS